MSKFYFVKPLCLCLLAFLVASLAPPACGQNVRDAESSTPFVALRRQGDTAADQLNRYDWPRITTGEAGTQVHLTFDVANADIVLMTNHDFGQQALLFEAQKIARLIVRPQADYILSPRKNTVTTDIELNKYLKRDGKKRTESDVDFSALASALNASQLPRPIVLCIHGKDADRVCLVLPNGVEKMLTETAFYGQSEIPANSHLKFVVMVPWYAPVMSVVFVGLGFVAIVGAILAPWQAAKRKQNQTPLNPEEVQRRYNKRLPSWLSMFPAMAMLIPIFIRQNGSHLHTIIYSFPITLSSQWQIALLLVAVAAMGLSYLACFLKQRSRQAAEGSVDVAIVAQADPDALSTPRTLFISIVAVLPLMLSMMILVCYHGANAFTIFLWTQIVAVVCMIVTFYYFFRSMRQNLSVGDPMYDAVSKLADQAHVKVRGVVLLKSRMINAFASLTGTITLTSALVRKMEPDEVRAIIAHELGHLKAKHPQRNVLVGLSTLTAFLVLRQIAIAWAEAHGASHTDISFSGQMITILVGPLLINLILGRGRRKREEEADRFAVELTGDPDLVIRALTKLHTLNAAPRQLKPSDEILSTHPSLEHRIMAIQSLPFPLAQR